MGLGAPWPNEMQKCIHSTERITTQGEAANHPRIVMRAIPSMAGEAEGS